MSYPCPDCDEDLPTEHGLSIHRGKIHGAQRKGVGPIRRKPPPVRPVPDPPAEPDDEVIDAGSPFAGPTAEIAPKEPAPWRERLWGDPKAKEPKEPRVKPAPAERRPRPRRVSTEGIWSAAYTGGGLLLVRTGADVPVGNCLQFQAPTAGAVLDEVIAGTWVDRVVLQRIATGGEKLKKTSNVVGMPLLVFAIQRAPVEMVPMLEMLLREMIRENLVEMAKAAKAKQRADERYRKALTDLGMDAGDDPVDAVLTALFAKPPTPDANGNGAGPAYATTHAAAAG